MSVDVQRLGPADWQLWRGVRLAALADAPEAFGSSLDKEQGYTDEQWRAWMAPDRGLKAVARTPGGTAGVIGVWVPDDSDPEVYSMWVHPHSRGTGVGDRLVSEALAWAGEQRLEAVMLWVVGDNAAARRLYERHGFEATGESQPYPRDPARIEYVMRRTL
ncbi:GNAT family N-acetyltransferase [Dactylosporangium matsuzakiense]|uniref:GNAT family N-acetyltransferase n=1 Tax=Dactylosporangium matsuzakiense TaxID=53360 RepID=UPI0021C25F86|nr:GNAT family N-acetyltransferase [Dactylosporangium matsuzakiense]UWZ48018.1 GNAT family N-acetyltransferase [Dactylosporangium matsuzakiense]